MNIIEAAEKMRYGATVKRKNSDKYIRLRGFLGEFTTLELTGNDLLAEDWEVVEWVKI